MRKYLALPLLVGLLISCSSGSEPSENRSEPSPEAAPAVVDAGKGIGEYTHVELHDQLDKTMVARGQEIYDLKCSACHKLTDQRLVGPGFRGVTERRKPEWILNMVTNVDVMLEKDEAAQELLKECLVRMPNQNLSAEDARSMLEFFLSNDRQAAKN